MNARIAPPPIWPGPEDVERVHRHGRQPELVVVGVRHVLAGELRDGVRPARLADRADRRDLALLDVVGVRAEDLARREVDEALERRRASRARPRARCRCRSRSRASSAPGSRARSRRRRSRRSGRSASRRARPRVSGVGVEDVALVEREVRVVGEVGARERVAVEVVERDDLVPVDELARERRADEAGAAGDEDPLALEPSRRSVSLQPRGSPLAAWLEARGTDEDLDALWRRPAPADRARRARRAPRPASRRDVARGALSRARHVAELERVRRLDDAVAWAAAQRAAGERPRNMTAPPGTDERPIEIPWCLSRYAGERGARRRLRVRRACVPRRAGRRSARAS